MVRGAVEDGPHPVDRHVGRRVCEKRIALGYNQSDLGRALGLTFQQIQKYKRDQNRIPIARPMLIVGRLGTSNAGLRQGLRAMAQALDARKAG